MIKNNQAKEIITDIVDALIKRRAYGASTAGRIKNLIRLKQLGSLASPDGIAKELEDAIFHGFIPVDIQPEVNKLVSWIKFRTDNHDTFPVPYWRSL